MTTPATNQTNQLAIPDEASTLFGDNVITIMRLGGIDPDPEQQQFLRAATSIKPSGDWYNRTVADAEPRQQGKGENSEARELTGAMLYTERVLHTAHELPTCKEAFERAEAKVTSTNEFDERVGKIRYSNGEWAIPFTGGGKISYGARTKSAGRGFTKIGLLTLDEAQEVKAEHLAAATPAMAAADYPQVWMSGSGGLDYSEEWWRLRKAGAAGEDGLLFHELTAERMVINADGQPEWLAPLDVTDEEIWTQCCPALKTGRISYQYMRDQLVRLGPEKFAREHLCIWDILASERKTGNDKLPKDIWQQQYDPKSTIIGEHVLAVQTDWQQNFVSIAVAGRRADNTIHVELVGPPEPGIEQAEMKLVKLLDAHNPRKVVIAANGPTREMVPTLTRLLERRHQTDLMKLSGSDNATACRLFVENLRAGRIWHIGDPSTTAAVSKAAVRKYGTDESWQWELGREHDVTPLAAMTVATWAAEFLELRSSVYGQGVEVGI